MPTKRSDLQLGSDLFDFMAATLRQQAVVARALDPTLHRQDEDCVLTLKDDTCTVCGVFHGDLCDGCGARAFHRATCVDRALPTERWSWCRDGRHAECRTSQDAGDGTMDRCGCVCHRGGGE